MDVGEVSCTGCLELLGSTRGQGRHSVLVHHASGLTRNGFNITIYGHERTDAGLPNLHAKY